MRAIDKRLRRLEGARRAGSQPKTLEELRHRIAVLIAKAAGAEPADIYPDITTEVLRRIAETARTILVERRTNLQIS